MIIAVDFDGTCVKHAYPKIGEDIGAVPVLRRLVKDGNQIILNTMRSGDLLDDAVNWFTENDIPLTGVNKYPGQETWTQSSKAFATCYIDDHGLGCPTTSDGKSIFVDWRMVAMAFGYKYDNLIEDGK